MYILYNYSNLAFTSHNPYRKNILIEISEKEEEEDSTLRNESLINQKKNDIKNQSDIIFNLNKNLIVNNNNCKRINNESKKDKNQNEIKRFNKINININENKKENNSNLFNK